VCSASARLWRDLRRQAFFLVLPGLVAVADEIYLMKLPGLDPQESGATAGRWTPPSLILPPDIVQLKTRTARSAWRREYFEPRPCLSSARASRRLLLRDHRWQVRGCSRPSGRSSSRCAGSAPPPPPPPPHRRSGFGRDRPGQRPWPARPPCGRIFCVNPPAPPRRRNVLAVRIAEAFQRCSRPRPPASRLPSSQLIA